MEHSNGHVLKAAPSCTLLQLISATHGGPIVGKQRPRDKK